jgi:FixJ family two-component response regulator
VTHTSTPGKEPVQEAAPIVYVVDDDESLRTSLRNLLRSVGLQVELFASASEFLDFEMPDAPSCLVLDVRLKGQSGLAFQSELAGTDIDIPIIFMTAHGDIAMSVRAMKAGALDFLAKPFRDQDMLDAIDHAIEHDRQRRKANRGLGELRAKYETLTLRERQVMSYVIAGLLNKQIAAEVFLSEITVKIHRAQAMKKMEATSVADLVRKAEALGIEPASPKA